MEWEWLAGPAALLMIGLGMGSCTYLMSAGDARVIEAKAALKAAEKCSPSPAQGQSQGGER